TTWGALGGGALSGKYEKGKPYPKGDRLSEGPWGQSILTDKNLAIGAAVREVAIELGKPASQVALAWVLAQRGRAQVIPIVGARRASQLEDNLGALALELPQTALAKLEEASRIELGFPLQFLGQVKSMIHGETHTRTDNHRA